MLGVDPKNLELLLRVIESVNETTQKIYDTIGLGGIAMIGTIGMVGALMATGPLAKNIILRQVKRDELRPFYDQGIITEQPTIFNAYRLEREAFPTQPTLFSE